MALTLTNVSFLAKVQKDKNFSNFNCRVKQAFMCSLFPTFCNLHFNVLLILIYIFNLLGSDCDILLSHTGTQFALCFCLLYFKIQGFFILSATVDMIF